MTYENVISWAEKHLPLNEYDTFADWYKAVKDKVNTPALFGSSTFNRMMEDRWLGEFGTFDRIPPEAISQQTSISQFPPSPTVDNVGQSEKAIVIMPKTGQAPVIPKPVLVFPPNIEQKKKESILSKFRNIFRRKKK